VKITEIHHLIAFASIVVGESATMASESAVLGVPAIFISDTLRGYTIEEEKTYGLVYNLSRKEIGKALNIIDDIYQDTSCRQACMENHARLLAEKRNVTEYILSEIQSFFKKDTRCAGLSAH
jgi:hypothetical protein